MSDDKIDRVTKISNSVSSPQKITPQAPEPIREKFDQALNKESVAPVADTSKQAAEAVAKPSLMDEVRNSRPAIHSRSSPNEILAQLDDTLNRIDKVKDKLQNSPDLKLKGSVQEVMRKKLEHIDESLKSAFARVDKTEAGLFPAEVNIASSTGPIQKFLGLLTQGQERLYSLSTALSQVAEAKNISPASLIVIQMKVNAVQQEIELFTSLLNKALESTKTLMNVQV